MMMLSGLVIQKVAGVTSSLRRLEEGFTKTPRLYWKVLFVSIPSSRKKAPPMTLYNTWFVDRISVIER